NTQDPGVRELVWGSPWRSPVAFPGLAYCLGGRSLYWGGWSPRLTPADLAQWPGDLVTFFNDAPAGADAYRQTEREIGVDPATDYISGPLYDELHKKMDAVIKAPGGVPSVEDRKSTRLNSSHLVISYAVFCLKKKNTAKHKQM